MTTVNMLEAKTNLSKLVDAVESGAESEIIIARNGRPAARLVPIGEPEVDTSKRLGIAEGQLGEWTREMAAEWDRQMKEMWKEWLKEPILPRGRKSSSTRGRGRR